MISLLGEKLKMSQIWKDNKAIPVTFIRIPPQTISMVRTKERDGYSAVQLKLGKRRREFRVEEKEEKKLKVNDTMDLSLIKENDVVKVSGISRGRGFQGVVKRHGFSGGPKTHGQKNRLRAPGSIGSTAPQRVLPGRRMAGRMGGERVTIKNLTVLEVLPDQKILVLKGAVPGAPGGLLEISKIEKRNSIRK